MLDIGERVAGFQVEEFVARGGMAVVYRARDLALGRTVALKVIAPELAQNESFRLRFTRESELAASLDHPNVIPIYAAGEADDLLYLVMRYVAGDDLGTVIKDRRTLGPREALPLFTQVAGALDAAHARDLVHRDVKPGNILLAGDTDDLAQRHVYLSDFGLTKRMSSLSGFTTAGHFIGTIQYVSPEQVANRPVDHRSDIYSMGCVIYEAFTGEPPFVCEDDAAMLWSHLSLDPPLVSERRDGLPLAVDQVLQRALAKDPADRQQDCRTVVAELRAAFRPARPRATGQPTAEGSGDARPTPPVRAKPSSGGDPLERLKGVSSRLSLRRPGSAKGTTPPHTPPSGSSVPTAAQLPTPTPATASAKVRAKDARPKVKAVSEVKGRSRDGVKLAALLVALALVVAAGVWLVVGRDSYVSYPGTYSEGEVVVSHPQSWKPFVHDSAFVVLSPTDLTSIWTPDHDWSQANRLAAENPDDLVGAYLNSTKSVDPSSYAPLDQQVETQFEGLKVDALPAAATGNSAITGKVTGTMASLADPASPTLYFELVVLPPTSASPHGVEVMLFCRLGDEQHNQDLFRKVIASLTKV